MEQVTIDAQNLNGLLLLMRTMHPSHDHEPWTQPDRLPLFSPGDAAAKPAAGAVTAQARSADEGGQGQQAR